MKKEAHRQAVLTVMRKRYEALLLANQDALPKHLREFWDFFARFGEFTRKPAVELLREAASRFEDPALSEPTLAYALMMETWTPPPKRLIELSETPAPPQPDGLRFGEMKRGDRFLVNKSFTDFGGKMVEAGRCLTFHSYHYFPYDGGFSVHFEELSLRLAEIDTASREILSNLEDYLRPLPKD